VNSLSDKKIVVIGCGDIGTRLALGLQRQAVQVYGLRRQVEKLPASIIAIRGDVTNPKTLQPLSKHQFDTAIITLTPGEYSEQRYQLIFAQGLANVLPWLRTRHLIFVSSTSVYHQTDGQWVNEDSPTNPSRFNGQYLLRAEKLVRSTLADSTVVRFSGIYGPDRPRLVKQVLAGRQSAATFSNRIHRDDCVGFLQHLIVRRWQNAKLHSCYLASDSEPALLSEVKSWIAQRLQVDLPKIAHGDELNSLSKRCNNQRMLESGYSLEYPDFRLGYGPIIEGYGTKP